MKLSQKAEYAMRAMFELAQRENRAGEVRSAEIAKREKIPGKFLELILVELRRNGLVKSRRGPEGGHRLARPASAISVGEIWRAIDGPFLPGAELGDRRERDVTLAASCFHSVWKEVETAIGQVVDRISLEDLCRRAEAKQGVWDFSI